MKTYSKVHSQARPKDIEITDAKVLVAKNITSYQNDGVNGFEYDCEIYDKNEYIVFLAEQNQSLQNELLDTQAALCDIYEAMGGF